MLESPTAQHSLGYTRFRDRPLVIDVEGRRTFAGVFRARGACVSLEPRAGAMALRYPLYGEPPCPGSIAPVIQHANPINFRSFLMFSIVIGLCTHCHPTFGKAGHTNV
jgi:hypothetical protein